MSLDHVRVHYHSAGPSQLNSLAYAQGTDIYIRPGEERHLPHEVWHIVQRRHGRVSTNGRSHIGLSTNEEALEIERDLLAKRTPL